MRLSIVYLLVGLLMLAACSSARHGGESPLPHAAGLKSGAVDSHKRFVRGSVRQIPGWRSTDTPPIVLHSSNYDYAASIMLDGLYRMWWCNTTNDVNGNGTGDQIAYAESSSLSGPWHGHLNTGAQFDVTICNIGDAAPCTKPQSTAAFDAAETCDPSVLRVGATYYMYYGGLGSGTSITRVGLAQSNDGYSWTRSNGGQPIVQPANSNIGGYGAGQPSVVFVKPYFYMMYHDSTGLGGPGMYVLRSTDPSFQTNLQRYNGSSFQGASPNDPSNTSTPILGNVASADWTFADTNQTFIIANTSNSTTVLLSAFAFGNDTIQGQVAGSPSALSFSYGSIVEGPGLLTRPDRHALPSTTCGQIPITLIAPVGSSVYSTWTLEQMGSIIDTSQTCSQVPLGDVFEGSLLTSANAPLAMIAGGKRLQFALAPPAQRLARNAFTVSNEIFFGIPYAASMYSGNTVYGAPGRPGAFLFDDNNLWAVSCYAEVADDLTSITSVSTSTWDSHGRGPDLLCLSNT